MISALGLIATINIGMVLQKTDTTEGYCLLQQANFDGWGRWSLSSSRSFVSRDVSIPDRAWVQAGDVLLIGKGTRNTAIYYREDYPEAVASATFYILRLTEPDVLLPEFLACYLNQSATQAQLRSRISSATTVPTLNKKELLDLPVPMLPMATQQYLVGLHNTFLTIRDLNQQLTNHHENLVTQCFSTTISDQTHLPRN